MSHRIDTLLTSRTMPQNEELERNVLGCCLAERNSCEVIMDMLLVTDFRSEANQTIYQSLINLKEKGIAIDLLTCEDELKRMGRLDAIGGINYLTEVFISVTSTANVEYYGLLLQETAIRREIIEQLTKYTSLAFGGEKYASELIFELVGKLELINRIREKPESIGDLYRKILDSGEIEGMKTGFSKLDQITNGLWGYVVLAAGPGEGKSVFSLNIARNVAMRGIPVILFSLEMKKAEIIFRLMSDEMSLSVRDVMANKYSMDKALRSYIPELPLHIFDDGSLTVDDMAAICKGLFKQQKGLIIIDYLQLLTGGNGRKFGTRENEVAYISRKIKQLQMDLDTPILALSQLSRDKQRKFYQLSDLRESGAIEQDANGVLFIYRPIAHNQTEYQLDGKSVEMGRNDAVISIGKWRLGDTGDFRMRFNGMCSRFEDMNEGGYSDYIKPMTRPTNIHDYYNNDLPF